MDDAILNEMQEVAANAPDFTPRALTNPNNKWLVRSAFQKAMRRGQLDRALAMGEYLFHNDEGYAYTSLATVAIEDIGFGCADLISYTCMATLKSLRDKMHSDMLFAGLVKLGCEVPKSRSCCEISLGADISEKQYSAKLKDAPDDELGELMVGDDVVRSYLATKEVRRRLRGKGDDALIPALTLIRDALSEQAPYLQRAAMLSFERTVDSMNLALFPILHKLPMHGEMAPVKDKWPPSTTILSVGSEAFDMHELRGKKAIKAFWSRLRKKYDILDEIPGDKVVKAMGSLIFIAEGGQVDRRWINPWLKGLKHYQDRNFAIGYGCPEDHWEDMLEIVEENIEELNECREWAVNL